MAGLVQLRAVPWVESSVDNSVEMELMLVFQLEIQMAQY